MLPGLSFDNRFVPKSTGENLIPMFTLAQFGLDAELSPGLRLFYLQKARVIWGSVDDQMVLPQFFDSRFGVRKTQLFNNLNLQSELDFYIQPGLSRTVLVQPNRLFDLGMRMTNRYTLPGSHFTVGANAELNTTFYGADSTGADLSGLLSVMGSYRASSVVSVQSWVYGFYKHRKGDAFGLFYWDIFDLPFIQNGLSFALSREVSLSWMVNNYIGAAPTFQNMWTSLWFSMSLG
jgi:hypothetical protein